MKVSEKKAYNNGNKVGVVEGLEIAALYHDYLAEKHMQGAKFGDEGNPINGHAFAVFAHREHARKIRDMK